MGYGGCNVLGIIIARAGSKGLPGKNVTMVCGRPMVGWTIEHALGAGSLDQVIVSTDGDEIANVARAMGIEVSMRPDELASDTATIDSAARHALHWAEKQYGKTFEVVVILYGNVPVRPGDLTDRAVRKLVKTRADSVQSLCAAGKTHPYWMKRLSGAGGDVLEPYEDNNVYRRQDLPPVYVLDGGIIAVTRESLRIEVEGQPHAFLGKDRRAVVTEIGEVVDVDDEIDLAVAKAMLRRKSEGKV